MGQNIKYRRDIDGLRAVAVSLVIVFHLNVPYFPGGYVGVDVFFVISGFLISSIIATEVSEGRFSILRFYERRARRILPALMIVLAVTSIASIVLLLPSELESYARSLFAATFSFSNFYFWKTSNYFENDGHARPLLHTWSLAVEEQFYVFFPLFLLTLAKFKRSATKSAIVAAAIISFAWWVYASYESPGSAFYLPISRAWELMLGSMLALGMFPKLPSRAARELVAAAGLAFISFASIPLANFITFPGFPVALACAGAVLIVAAGASGESTAGNFLSLGPIVFIGLISYSAYLWHYPIIVFARMGLLPIQQRLYLDVALFVLSLVFGALSWRFIEAPFRTGTLRSASRKIVFGSSAVAASVCTLIAVVILVNHGFEGRFPESATKIAAFIDIKQNVRAGKCFLFEPFKFEDFKKDLCMHMDPGKKTYLLLGDSHAAALWYGLSENMPDANILQATAAGCSPGIDTLGTRDCVLMKHYIYDDFLKTHQIDGLFITANWLYEQKFLGLRNTVTWAKQHHLKVVIFGNVMQYDAALPRLLAYSIALHQPNLPVGHERTYLAGLDRASMHEAVDVWHVPFISLIDAQCENAVCKTYADQSKGIPMLIDEDHMSNLASAQIVQKVLPQLKQITSQTEVPI